MQQVVINGYRMSPQQRRVWSLVSEDHSLKVQCALLLEGALDQEALKRAVFKAVELHEILRTTFDRLPGFKLPAQIVAESMVPSWRALDLSGESDDRQRAEIENLFEQERRWRCDYRRGPLLACTLVKLSDKKHVILIDLSALCADAWSMNVLVSQIIRYYEAELNGTELSAEPVQYAQFSEWQNDLLGSEELEAVKEYWASQPALAASTPSLPFEHQLSDGANLESLFISIAPDARMVERINRCIEKSGASAEAFFLSCWLVLLRRLAKEPELAVSVCRHGRVFEEMNEGLGLYARWPFVQLRLQDDFTFTEVLENAGRALAGIADLQEYFSWELFGDCEETINSRISQSIGFDHHDWVGEHSLPGLGTSVVNFYSCTDSFKLRLSSLKTEDSYTFGFHADRKFYSPEALKLISERFEALLASVLEDDGVSISDLNVIGESERRRMLETVAGITIEFPKDKCIHELFQEQAARTPQSTAVVLGDAILSYGELNSRANRLARHLRALGVGPESVVALWMERSVEMIVGLLAILKAGAAYTPIDPVCPKERAVVMLDDCAAHIVVTHQRLAGIVAATGIKLVDIDSDAELIAQYDDSDLEISCQPEMLAYVIYTSGSTGKPKGVMIEHRSVANLAGSLQRAIYRETSGPLRVSLNAVLSFDSSVKQVVQLLRGHALYIFPEEVRPDGRELLSFISRNQVDVLDCTPSQLSLILLARDDFNLSLDAELVLIGGEALDSAAWGVLARDDATKFYNVYGPTECTVDATSFCVNQTMSAPSIGRPLANTRVYILDDRQQLMMAGASGEIYISGAGVGRGYVNRPDLTAERFIPDPFAGVPGARMYKTGDLGYYLPDGNITFLGRIDNQVKIRGTRIELGEIETLLGQHDDVKEAAVVVREEALGDKRLIAYVVPKVSTPNLTVTLRHYLKDRLPEYMIPAEIMTLESFPLNRSGKLDRKALAQQRSDAKDQAAERSDESEEKTPAEEMLAGIWSQVLSRERVGAGDNFFELGGHSLLATQVMSRVREVFKAELPLRSIFEAPTLRGLARRLEEERARSMSLLSPPMISVPKNGGLPLSFAQQRLWFIHQLFPDSAAYHVPAAIRLEGLLNIQAIRRSLAEIIRRHEVLRTTFRVVEDEPVQVIDPQPKLVMTVIDLSALCEQAREAEASRIAYAEARRGFDLEQGPLLRLTLLRLAEQSSVLVMSMHHIVSDGWSTSLFVRELQVLYDAYSSGRSSPLAELPVQYADFSVWQRGWLKGEVLDEQLAYWRSQLEGAPAALNIPTKQPRATTTSNEGATFAVEVSKDVSEATREFCRREGVTFFMMLFTAFNVLLSRFSGQRDILVGTNIANRNRIETEGMIGFFVNMLVLRTRLSEDQSFRQLLGQVRHTTLDAYAHQDVPFEKIVEELRPERDISRSPFFQVVFTLQNNPPRSLKLSGLDITGVPIELGATTYDLIFNMRDTGQGLIASMTYNKNLFDASLIERMVGSAETLLSTVIENPDLSLSELEVILRQSDARRIAAVERQFAEARKRKLQSVKRRTIEVARLT